MINLPENGYTPANYKALVELTKLSNADFYRTFAIPEQTFYKHRSGARTMKWQEWQLLINAVKRHLTTSENDMTIYKANKHSDAVKFMTNYYVRTLGYKLFEPNVEAGVFAVASKEDGLILNLLDNKSIKKTDGHRKELGFLSESDFKKAQDEYYEVASASSQDE